MMRATIYLSPGEVMIPAEKVAGAMAEAMFPPPERNKLIERIGVSVDPDAVQRLNLERELSTEVRRQFGSRETLPIGEVEEFMRKHDFSLGVERRSDRLRELAGMQQLYVQHWIEITGVGIGPHESYDITEDAVTFRKHEEDFIKGWPLEHQREMLAANGFQPLTFPCSPRQLVDFVDNSPSIHNFSLPDEFRETQRQANALRQMPDMTGWASWRSALLQRWEDIREYYQKEPNGRDAIVWAVKCGPSVFVRDQTVSNDFQWLDADGEVQKTGIHQAQNAVADWRKRGFIPSPK